MARAREGKRIAKWMLPVFLTGTLLGLSASGCGAAGDAAKPAGPTSSSAAPRAETGPITTSAIPPGQRFRGDGDADNPGDIDGNGDVDSSDADSDYPIPASYKLPDEDDRPVFHYGHSPRATEGRAIANVAERYYAAAGAGDGASACSLLLSGIASSVAQDYGQAGPPYLRGGKTCQAVLSMLFEHFREQLTEAVTVVEVRVDGVNAQVVLGSRKMPASTIPVRRQGRSWRIGQLLAQPLP